MSKKQKKILFRIIISAVLTVIAAVIETFVEPINLISAIIYLIPYFIIGYDVLRKAILNIIHGQIFDENFLMAIATVGAFGTGEYREAVAVMLFYQIGELFQNYAVGKSRKSITALMDICPDVANVLRDGEIREVSPDDVRIGETIVVRPGEKIPLDGVVTEGTSYIDTSALTGESKPTEVYIGDSVISGCINSSGLIKIEVKKEYGESTVAKILDLVENSSAKKAKSENFITKFSKIYTPIVVISAVLLAIIPPLFLHGNTVVWKEWFSRALTFLVISCPCALVISVPLSFFGGIGGASKCGILIKGGNYLEALSKAETVVFDKTGTLTKGIFEVTNIYPAKNISKENLLEIAATAESFSTHPIAQSVTKAYGKPIIKEIVSSYTEIAGKGIKTIINNNEVLVGNEKLMSDYQIEYQPSCQSGTVLCVAINGSFAGEIIISDIIKDESETAISELKRIGIKKTVMLTGDNDKAGREVADKLHLDEVHTQLLPADKVRITEELLENKNKKSALCFVGDGINDAPVLSRADVGIAMGAIGSDAAIEAADIVLMDDNPSKIALAIKISKRTLRIVKENIIFALAVKLIILVLGALGYAGMWAAVFADVGVAVIAIINAMRALKPVK